MDVLLAIGWRDFLGWFLIAVGVAMVIVGFVMLDRAPDLRTCEGCVGIDGGRRGGCCLDRAY